MEKLKAPPKAETGALPKAGTGAACQKVPQDICSRVLPEEPFFWLFFTPCAFCLAFLTKRGDARNKNAFLGDWEVTWYPEINPLVSEASLKINIFYIFYNTL